ncbi:RE1 [Symbiodinium sp. CCMP2592]|nr:RE1 [Symbiodinium sp. CCMP2592]
MASAGGYVDVPGWDGNPSSFQAFEVACKWFEKTLKEAERRGAAARVWARLSGPAKSVVKHLSADGFDQPGGLGKLLEVLRSSPLQTLPIPDSFAKLEKWHQLRRKDAESIPELLVREDELFLELQQSLRRSRARGPGGTSTLSGTTPAATATPPATPTAATAGGERPSEEAAASPSSAPKAGETKDIEFGEVSGGKPLDFFEDELRGFRLLKASGISYQERQQVLTLTGNSVAFDKVRQALRALFDDADPASRQARRKIWWAEEAEDEGWAGDGAEDDAWGWLAWSWEEDPALYWAGSEWEWADWPEEDVYYDGPAAQEEVDPEAPETDEHNLVAQEQEAQALAAEANRTLTEARAAVAKVRVARGYFPLSGKKGSISGKKGQSKSMQKGKFSKGPPGKKGKTFGKGSGCLLCGSQNHLYRDCPGRAGKGPGKQKGARPAYWQEPVYYSAYCMEVIPADPENARTDDEYQEASGEMVKAGLFLNDGGADAGDHCPDCRCDGPPRVEHLHVMSLERALVCERSDSLGYIVDTGATENAVGVKTLEAILTATRCRRWVDTSDRPVFRFGDGLSLRASSKLTLGESPFGKISFYVLDGDHRPSTCRAEDTQALIGSKFLRESKAAISYEHLKLWFLCGGDLLSTDLSQTTTGHLMVPVAGKPLNLSEIRKQAEEQYSVLLPPDAPSVLDLMATPGAFEELRRLQGSPRKSAEVFSSMCPVPVQNNMPSESVSACDLPPRHDSFMMSSTGQLLAFEIVPPPWPRRIESLWRRVQSLNLRLSSTIHGLEDGGTSGRSATGRLALPRPTHFRTNTPEPVGLVDGMFQVRLHYVVKRQGHGGSRAGGPTPDVVMEAVAELRDMVASRDMTEKIMKGKILEVQGRRMVAGHRVALTTLMEEREPEEPPVRGRQPTPPIGSTTQPSRPTGPTLTTAALESLESQAPKARPKATTRPQEQVVDRRELEEALENIAAQEQKVKALKKKLKKAMAGSEVEVSSDHSFEAMSEEARQPGIAERAGERVQADGVEHRPGDTCGCPCTGGLPCREKGFTSATRRSMNAAGFTYFMTLLCTTTALMNSIERAELLEINGTSSHGHFGDVAEKEGITYELFSAKTGYYVEKKNIAEKVVANLRETSRPAFLWIAPAVKGAPSLGHWAQESPTQARNRQRAQRRCLEVAEGACDQIREGLDFVWEWPLDLGYGRDSPAIHLLRQTSVECGRPLYELEIDGRYFGEAAAAHGKRWMMMTTSRQLSAVLRRCHSLGDKPSVPEGPVTWPERLVKMAIAGIHWELKGQGPTLADEVYKLVTGELGTYALARTSGNLPVEQPAGKKLSEITDMMLRIHRASGHTSMENLAKLLQRRGAPGWAVEMARSLECCDCQEAQRIKGPPPSSLEDPPGLWEVLHMDVFEVDYKENVDGTPTDYKAKFLLMVDRASRFTMVHLLKKYPASEGWEPSTYDIRRAIVKTWLGSNPAPKWLLADAAAYFTSREMLDFCGRSGTGLLIAPAEAHWVLGIEERTIQTIKRASEKIDREDLRISIEDAMVLAAHGHNSFVHAATGYSPYQWARGWQREDTVPVGLDPRRAFNRMLLLRAKAEAAFARADAAEKMTRLNNTTSRKPKTFSAATGSTLVRAKLNQVRPVTEREKLVATTQGTTVYQQAVGDLAPATVRVEPRPAARADKNLWEFKAGTLVRRHHVARLTLFVPQRTKDSPVEVDHLTGKRRTIIQVPGGGQTIEDDFTAEQRPGRALMERWTGETQFQIKPQNVMYHKHRCLQNVMYHKHLCLQNVMYHKHLCLQDVMYHKHLCLQDVMYHKHLCLQDVMCHKHLCLQDVMYHKLLSQCGRNHRCRIQKGEDLIQMKKWRRRHQYLLSFYLHKCSQKGSSSDEELVADRQGQGSPTKKPRVNYQAKEKKDRKPENCDKGYACEIEVRDRDLRRVLKKPLKAGIWLSQKMAEKSKEVNWRHLTLEEKAEFDTAMATEVTNVVREQAVRALSRHETSSLDLSRAMNMRWVLTRKADGRAKARLVVLGFQAPNLTEVETAAPTLSRTGRHVLLSCVANHGFTLESGDVTSAFLQTIGSLESENLLVKAPAELAVMFGADPNDDSTVLKLVKAFYGLVHAPRRWHDSVVKAMVAFGWRQMQSDRCLFALYDKGDGRLIAIAGLHVDDFLIGGIADHPEYVRAKKDLQQQFKFGKWDQASGDGFVFAGTHIRQTKEGITVDQREYISDWVAEIPLTAARARELKSPLTVQEISDLRGALGTMAWKSSQTGPHLQADVSLKLSEIPFANVKTLVDVNKMIREMRRTADQSIVFPAWHRDWRDIATVVWADASQGNRPNKSSTIGYVACLGPKEILQGEEVRLAMVAWKSSKCPRETLGSNGAEVQAVTVGEDMVFMIRALWLEVHGAVIERNSWENLVAEKTMGALVTDSKGIFDAMTRNVSALHGLHSSRAGFELTVTVQQAMKLKTQLRWVNGVAQLADAMTKAAPAAKKGMLEFYRRGQTWSVVHDPSFTAGKKLHKAKLLKEIQAVDYINVCAFVPRSAFVTESVRVADRNGEGALTPAYLVSHLEDGDTPATSTVVSAAASEVASDSETSVSLRPSLRDGKEISKRKTTRITFEGLEQLKALDRPGESDEEAEDEDAPKRAGSDTSSIGKKSDASSMNWRADALDVGENLAAEAAAKKGHTSVDSIVALVQAERERWEEERQALEVRVEELQEQLRSMQAAHSPDAEKQALKREHQELRKVIKARSRFGAWVCERHMMESDDEETDAEKEARTRTAAADFGALREASGSQSGCWCSFQRVRRVTNQEVPWTPWTHNSTEALIWIRFGSVDLIDIIPAIDDAACAFTHQVHSITSCGLVKMHDGSTIYAVSRIAH